MPTSIEQRGPCGSTGVTAAQGHEQHQLNPRRQPSRRDDAARVARRISFPIAALGKHALVIYVGQHIIGSALNRTLIDERPVGEHLADLFEGFDGEGRYVALSLMLMVAAMGIAMILEGLDLAAKRRAG